MQCMKCGQNVEEPNVFCEVCLADMKNYPVRPGTVVQLPKYHEPVVRRQLPKRKQGPTLEEQVTALRKRSRILAAVLTVTLLLLIGAGWLLLRSFDKKAELLPGQNYSAATITTNDETVR